jgi:hypothetical protein
MFPANRRHQVHEILKQDQWTLAEGAPVLRWSGIGMLLLVEQLVG